MPRKQISARFILLILASVLFAACTTGYETHSGVVYYYSWNEGEGQNKKELPADAHTFKILKGDRYAKDGVMVFYNGNRVAGADAQSFEALNEYYAHDKYRGYHDGDSIPGSYGPSFHPLYEYYFSTDDRDVFYEKTPLHVCSVKNFKIVSSVHNWESWTTDGCSYYCKEYRIPSNDYKNVYLFTDNPGYAKDKEHVYFFDRDIMYDDTGHRLMDTVDVASFTVVHDNCRDKFGCINPYHGRDNCQ